MGQSIVIDVQAETASFINGMEKSGESVHRFGQRAEESGGMLGKFTEGLGIGSGVEAFHTGVELIEKGVDQVKEAFEEVGEIGRNALKLGVGAEEMSRFQHAANATHTDVGALSAGMDHLNRTIGQIAEGDAGAGKASAALAKLGLDANKLKDQSPAETFKQVAEALSHVGSTYERSAIAQEIFGKGGRELIPLMSHLDELMKESDDIGFTRTADQVEKVEQEERKLAAATDTVKGMFMDLATSPWAEKLIDGIKGAAAQLRQMLSGPTAGGAEGYDKIIVDAHHVENDREERKDAQKESFDPTSIDKRIEGMKKLVELDKDEAKSLSDIRAQQKSMGDAPTVTPEEINHVHALAKAHQLTLDTLLKQKTAADAAGKAQVAAAESARAAAEKMHDEAVKRNESNAKSVTEELARVKKELEEKQFGKQATGAEELIAKGATTKQIEDYKKLTDQLSAVESKEKDVAKAHSLWEAARTPVQKYQDELKELNELMAKGVLTKQQYDQIASKDKTDFEKGGQDTTDKADKTRAASLIERKFDFRMPGQSKDDPQKKVAELAQKQDQRADQWHTWFNKIYDYVNTAGSTQAVVFDPG